MKRQCKKGASGREAGAERIQSGCDRVRSGCEASARRVRGGWWTSVILAIRPNMLSSKPKPSSASLQISISKSSPSTTLQPDQLATWGAHGA